VILGNEISISDLLKLIIAQDIKLDAAMILLEIFELRDETDLSVLSLMVPLEGNTVDPWK